MSTDELNAGAAAKALDDIGELIDQLAGNAREFDFNTANRMERDAAKALLIIEGAINALPELLERVKRYESALEKIANPNTQITEVDEKYDEPVTVALDMWHAREIARVALNQETGQ